MNTFSCNFHNYSIKNIAKYIKFDYTFENRRNNKILKSNEEGIAVMIDGKEKIYKIEYSKFSK